MAPAGRVKFPQSGAYDNNLNCIWKISAPSGTVSGLHLEVHLSSTLLYARGFFVAEILNAALAGDRN